MQDLKDALHRLPKINPSNKFLKESKNRLMYQIEFQKNEAWFKGFLRRLGVVKPQEAFLSQARMRLMSKITAVRPSWAWLSFTKRLAASTLVTILAVTTTLFFVDGHQVVSAEESTYVEVVTGSASVKHADRLIWDEITTQVELAEGDLIKISEGSDAVVHFFDDTQVRLAENSLLLISKLAVSPAFAEQGMIEVSLHEGKAWVQTLNADDGYAGLTLITRDAIASVINSTFDVKTNLNEPTVFSVFKNKIELKTLQPDTRAVVDSIKINSNNQIRVTAKFNSTKKPQVTLNPITAQDRADEWVFNNLQKDEQHLVVLRENDINRLRQVTGVLPGTVFYPLKQAKERLQLAFSFRESSVTNAQIEIANKRLNEAIVLLQEGRNEQAMETLMIYQNIARQIAEEVKDQESATRLLVTAHQKTLIASLPTAPISIVKQALSQTEELLIEDPIEREKVRLENSVDRLHDAITFVANGDFNALKDILINNELIVDTLLSEVENVESSEEKKELLSAILDLRNEELALLQEIAKEKDLLEAFDPQLAAILSSAEEQAKEEVNNTIAFIRPLMPELIQEHKEQKVIDGRIQYFVDKIGIYQTWQGQQNQINRLLKEEGIKANNITFLTELRGHLDTRAKDYINTKILELQRIDRYTQHKLIQQKINRAIRMRQE